MADNKAVAKKEEKDIVFKVAGEDVRLSESIVNQFVMKGNDKLTREEAFNFIQLCRFRKLNPFLGEAYAVKYGGKPAQMVVGKAAFMRRAEEHPNFEGHRSGLILLRENKVIEVEGAFKLKSDELLGAWAEVYVKGRKFPVVAKVNLDEYNKGQSTWKEMKNTMIKKVALVQALRDAFPGDLNALYVEDEMTPSKEESIKSTIEEVKEEIQETETEDLNIPFAEYQDAEIVEEGE